MVYIPSCLDNVFVTVSSPVIIFTLSTADTWPEVFDDSGARADWGWSHDYNLTRLVETMVTRIDPNNPRLRT